MSSDEQEHEEQEEERVEEPKMATAKGRGKRLTDSERMEIIARLEDKSAPLSRAKCARLYGVTPAAISKLMKVSQTVKKRYSDAGVEAGYMRDKRQRGGFSKNMCFEDELFKWICSIRARRIPLLVAHVQQKAKLLAAKHQMNEDFKASNGWYYRFCARYGLAPGSLHAGGCSNGPIGVRTRVVDGQRSSIDVHAHRMNTGGVSDSEDTKERNSSSNNSADEKIKSVTVTTAAVWSDDPATSEKVGNLQDQVKKFGPEFVYSLSEARLFYKLLPNQLLPANQQNDGNSENGGSENDANAATKGNTERVMVLVCANGTGTHKIPLLVVGKHTRPSCFAVNQHGGGNTNQFSYYNQTSAAGHVTMQVGTSKYFSQREVWCDNQTFQYWCTSVFAPAIRARTTQPVLLLMDNPGGSLEEFQFANIATYFLPTRAGSLSAALQSGAASSTHAQFQPLQHGVIRELKRRYKIAVFQEVLSFLEKGDEERYRLLQRAMNRPLGAAGIAFGRLPHVADAMALLEDVWSAIPADLLRTGWVRSNLYSEGLHEYDSADSDQRQQRPDISDDTVVLELCSMLRHIKSVDELHGLPKEIRLWMYADDDASERMQQELLHDVQRLLQEEEEESKARGDVVSNATVPPPSQVNVGFVGSNSASYEHNGSFTSSLMHSTAVHQHQQHQQPVYGDINSINSNSSSSSMGYGYSLQQHLHNPQSHYNTSSLQPPQQLHHLQQQQQQHESPMALREQRKSISFALRALSNAEEALDNADVAEYFGDEATSDAIKSISTVLRRLRCIQRGKQSTLSALRPAAASAQVIAHTAAGSREPLNAHAASTSAHTYFYGDVALLKYITQNMAPSGRSNGATTTGSSSALRWMRSAAELKRDVLSLMRHTQSALSSDSDDTRLETHYQRFHEACSTWVATIFGSCSTSADATNTSSSHQEQQMQRRLQQQRQKNQAMCEQLTELTKLATHQQRDCGENRELVGAVVRSIGATAQIRTQRRKRKLPTASVNISAADANTNGDIGHVAEFVGVWLLHSSGLLRLEDVILGVVSGGVADTWEWLTTSVHYLLSRKAQRLRLASPAAEHSAAAALATTHGVVESVMQYIIRLAFTDSENTTTYHSHYGSYTSSHASEQAAMQVLEELCFFTCAGFSIPSLRLVAQLLSKRALLDDHLHDREFAHGTESISNASNNFGRLVVARDRVVAFLQPQVAKLASPYSLVQAAYTHDELEEIFAAYQSCLSTSTFVQIVRQFIYEASGSSSNDISPDAAMSGGPRSVVCNALYQLILSVACKRSDFVDQVLTLAHDLASEGIQGMNGFLLRHSLELVAAVSTDANTKKITASAEPATATRSNVVVDIYRDWVRDHFAAGQDTSAGSKATTTADDSCSTTTAPVPTLSLRCLKQHKTCSLVTSKRQIQFLCAFLLEFDRREQQLSRRKTGDRNPACSQCPVAKSNHVAAHLSVMKTHQPQFPSGGLIMDFCSQTRSRYLELLKIEQATTAAANAVEAANTNGQQTGKKQRTESSLHSAKVRNMVRENIQLYRDTKKLSPQLRQWKMFQPQLWKQELIPCCLDIDFDNLQGAEMSRDGGAGGSDRSAAESRLLEHVAFVQALAKSGLVSVQEYSQFLTFAEDWLERRQKRRKLKKAPHKQQRHEGDGEGFGPTLMRLQQEINGERSAKLWRQRNCVSQETMTKLRQALESTLISLYDTERSRNETIVSTKQMQSLWEDGCMRVLELFSLDEVDAFFAYLVPVLERSTSSSQKDTTDATPSTASQPQDKEDATMPGVSIANFFVSHVSWTEPIDESFLHEVSCLAVVVASLLGKSCGKSWSSGIHPDLVNLIQQIDGKIVASVETPGEKVLSHDRLLRRSLFCSTMLRAVALLSPDKQQDRQQDQAHIVKALLHCESLDPRIRDFISWIGYRSIVDLDSSQRSPTRDRQEAPGVLCEEARVQPLQFLVGNLCAVSQMKWYKETFSLEKISKKQLQKLITLEFRFGFKLFSGASTSTSGSLLLPPSATTTTDAGDLREWLQIELDVIADLGGFRIASVEDVIEWIIAEILLQVTSLSSSDDNLEVSSADNAVALMLLVLNDLMHKLNSQDIGAAKSKNDFQAGANRWLSSGSHDRILAFFVTSAVKLIRENGQVFPADLRLQHHGFEVFEICARHHIDCRFSKELVSTGGGGTLLELLSYIGDHFESRFPWSLLQALLFYLVELTSPDQEVSHLTAIRIRDIPAAIVIRCAMEYSQLKTVLERRRTSKNGLGSGKQDAVMKHLNWVHQFSQQVIQGDDDSVSSRDHESEDRKPSPFDRMEMFPSEVDKTKYQIQIVKHLFRWKSVQIPDLTTQSHSVSSFYRATAVRILQAFGASPRSGNSVRNDVRVINGHNNHMLLELATCFMNEWLQSAFVEEEKGSDEMPRQVDFHFQLFLVHAVAELCQWSAQVSKALLHSWRESRSSMVDGSALFIVLLVISLSNGDDTHVDQFEQVLRSNSSLWLNEFPKIALHVHSMSLLTSDPDGGDISSVVKLAKVIANAQSFADRLELVMIKALKHGIANQVDVLDAELPLHIRQAWPGLSRTVSQLHVLTLDSDDDDDNENPSEFLTTG